MPEMDGFEVVEKMYEDEKLKEVPIVVLTAKEITADGSFKAQFKDKKCGQERRPEQRDYFAGSE